jgi:hypothetical protein
MVNITDTFTKLYGRKPTPSEVQKMMQMKAKQDAHRNEAIKPKIDMIEKTQVGKENAIRYSKPKPIKETLQVAPKIIQINKLIWYKLTNEQIADVLLSPVENIEMLIKKFKLPRKGLVPQTYKTGARK